MHFINTNLHLCTTDEKTNAISIEITAVVLLNLGFRCAKGFSESFCEKCARPLKCCVYISEKREYFEINSNVTSGIFSTTCKTKICHRRKLYKNEEKHI